MVRKVTVILLLLAGLVLLAAQTPTVSGSSEPIAYVGRISADSVLLAWGTTQGGGRNTIGRDAIPLGKATVRVGSRSVASDAAWALVEGLEPDRVYPYEIDIDGKQIASGEVRTYPETATNLTFFVIGDYGTGNRAQHRIAEAMTEEFQRRQQDGDPVRFVLTTGDNIYADRVLGFILKNSGNDDSHWGPKFFEPYREIIRHIPFYPTLGNHDGNESENRGDLPVYLDNFFFPTEKSARYYSFGFGGLADFFALDTTSLTEDGRPRAAYLITGEQSNWLDYELGASKAPWKIPYFHHPPFSAGPRHDGRIEVLRHWTERFEAAGVKAAFVGHEHNFQVSQSNPHTGHIRHFITGAGGELRTGRVNRRMLRSHIEGWAAVNHFLVVEIEGDTMRVTPVSDQPFTIVNAEGDQATELPILVQLPEAAEPAKQKPEDSKPPTPPAPQDQQPVKR